MELPQFTLAFNLKTQKNMTWMICGYPWVPPIFGTPIYIYITTSHLRFVITPPSRPVIR